MLSKTGYSSTGRLGRGLALVLGTTLCITLGMSAQNNTERSPYSRFGYGNMASSTTAGGRALGGLGIGLRDSKITNSANPASYTSIDSMTFVLDMGLSARASWLSENGASDRKYLGNLDYITMHFPVTRALAMSAGIMPLSTTGYNFGSQADMGGDSNTEKYLRSYSGSGGYNKLYLGAGIKILPSLSVGANASFIFGSTVNNRQVSYTSSSALTHLYSDKLTLRGAQIEVGAQWEQKLDSAGNRSVTIGATFNPGTSLNGTEYISRMSVGASTTEVLQADTTSSKNYRLPTILGFGASYRLKDHYNIGLDLQYGLWQEAKYHDLQAEFQNQYKLAVYGEWIPNARARSLWSRVRYRGALTFANSYLKVPTPTGTLAGYHEVGASIGIGLPLVDRRSDLNLTVDYKHLRPSTSGMLKEHYLGLTLGITFNEGWFRRARVN